MATTFSALETSDDGSWTDDLARQDRAIGGPPFDALLLWGAPIVALVLTFLWVTAAAAMPAGMGDRAVGVLLIGVGILTDAHLVAVVPRAYLNRDVFARHRLRLVAVPPLLVAALLLSPKLLACGVVLAIFWDVHHSAMQTFGLSRIYDAKAGNDTTALRRVDLLLNWALYVGPITMGAALIAHFRWFDRFGEVGWQVLAQVPAEISGAGAVIRLAGIAAWLAITGMAMFEYRRAARQGYRMPAHKLALLLSTGSVSMAAWAFEPPFMAFATVNIFHAVQYFALVWLKEGGRMRTLLGAHIRPGIIFGLFAIGCATFGVAYKLAVGWHILLAPFVACSLLHFWFDGFVWSVRRREV